MPGFQYSIEQTLCRTKQKQFPAKDSQRIKKIKVQINPTNK